MKNFYYLTFYSYCGKSLDILIKNWKKLFYLTSINLKKKKTKFVVIKSPHNFNKSREHFETIIFKKLVIIKINTNLLKTEYLFNNFFKYNGLSLLGISTKKIKYSKNYFYL